jgi:SDR family mycofactocin-dependent oxidoreductase
MTADHAFSPSLLADRVAFITGGARGQGRSHALAMARAGADIVICDSVSELPTVPYELSDEADLAETCALVEAEGRRCIAERVDVRDLEGLERLTARAAEELGGLDFVVANAGIYSYAPNTWELTEDQWDVMLDVNLGGVWRTCKAAVPHMLAAGRGGVVVLISSVNGLRGIPGVAHYNAAKHGLVGLMRTMAIELAPHGVRVNTLHPTGVATGMTQNDAMAEALAAVEASGLDMTNLLPVELMDPEDVSNALVWLVSPLARYVTASVLPVDAGCTAK